MCSGGAAQGLQWGVIGTWRHIYGWIRWVPVGEYKVQTGIEIEGEERVAKR